MVWMSWWEKRKASRATTTPATWIQPSSGQFSFITVNNFISYSVCHDILTSLDFSHIDWLYGASPASSAAFAPSQRLISKLIWFCPLALTGGCIPAVNRLVDSGSVVSANKTKGPLNSSQPKLIQQAPVCLHGFEYALNQFGVLNLKNKKNTSK